MESYVFRTIEMTTNVCQTLQKNNDLMAIPGIGTAVNDLNNCLTRINDHNNNGTAQRRMLTSQAIKVKENLIGSIKFAYEKIDAFAVSIHNSPLRALVKISLTQLRQLSENDLINRAKAVIVLTTQHKEQLKDFHYKDADGAELNSILAQYVKINEDKKECDKVLKGNSIVVKGILTEIKTIFKDLDVIIIGCKREFPEVVIKYKIERNIKKAPRQQRSLQAFISNTATGTALANVRVEFYKDEDESMFQLLSQSLSNNINLPQADLIKVTTTLGKFNIKQMAPGVYTALIRKNGFKPQILRIYINAKETFQLIAQMEIADAPSQAHRLS